MIHSTLSSLRFVYSLSPSFSRPLSNPTLTRRVMSVMWLSPFQFTWSFSTMPMSSPSFSTRKSAPNICIVKSLFSNTSLSDAVSSLDLLRLKGIRLPSHILATLLRHCSKTRSFREGKLIHLHLKLTGFKRPPTLLANHLIAMYFSCGDFVQARQVFDKMNDRNLFTWNNMLSGYAKLGMMKQARSIFYRMPHKDYVSWNSMVSGYAHRGRFDEALRFYRRFRRLDVGYNEFSFASVLIVSVKLKEFELCRQIHGQVLVVGFLSNVVISSLIIDAYAKCGKMEDARRLFHDMPSRDVRAWTTLVSAYAAWGDIESSAELFSQMPKSNPCSWTSLIRGYSRNGMGHEALGVFREMIKHQVRPDQFTFSTCLLACATIASLKHGKQIHAFLVRNSIKPNTFVISAIVGMYLKCGRLETARRVFNSTGNKQDVELWNMILSTLAHYGYVTDKENGFVVDENSGLTSGKAEFDDTEFKTPRANGGTTLDDLNTDKEDGLDTEVIIKSESGVVIPAEGTDDGDLKKFDADPEIGDGNTEVKLNDSADSSGEIQDDTREEVHATSADTTLEQQDEVTRDVKDATLGTDISHEDKNEEETSAPGIQNTELTGYGNGYAEDESSSSLENPSTKETLPIQEGSAADPKEGSNKDDEAQISDENHGDDENSCVVEEPERIEEKIIKETETTQETGEQPVQPSSDVSSSDRSSDTRPPPVHPSSENSAGAGPTPVRPAGLGRAAPLLEPASRVVQ